MKNPINHNFQFFSRNMILILQFELGWWVVLCYHLTYHRSLLKEVTLDEMLAFLFLHYTFQLRGLHNFHYFIYHVNKEENPK